MRWSEQTEIDLILPKRGNAQKDIGKGYKGKYHNHYFETTMVTAYLITILLYQLVPVISASVRAFLGLIRVPMAA